MKVFLEQTMKLTWSTYGWVPGHEENTTYIIIEKQATEPLEIVILENIYMKQKNCAPWEYTFEEAPNVLNLYLQVTNFWNLILKIQTMREQKKNRDGLPIYPNWSCRGGNGLIQHIHGSDLKHSKGLHSKTRWSSPDCSLSDALFLVFAKSIHSFVPTVSLQMKIFSLDQLVELQKGRSLWKLPCLCTRGTKCQWRIGSHHRHLNK